MAIDPHAEIPRLRTALRDLVALSTIPAAWVGREPPAIVAGLADVLVGSLHLDFAFVRLCDPNGGAAVEVTRGTAWKAFPEWLQHHLAVFGQFSRKEIIPDVGGGMERCRGLLIPIGVNAEGGLVAAACDRTDFPTEIDQLLFSVAANHAATAFQSARLIHERRRAEEELRQARDELEMKVAERTAELRRSEAYSAEAQRLSHTGSFGWKVSSGEIYWSEETFRIFQYDRTTKPTMELVLQRVHPKDAALVKQTIERASQDGKDFDFERRLLMPDGSVKYVHVVAHALSDESGSIEYVGSAMDITEQHQARAALEKAFTEIKKSEDQLRIIIDTIPTLAWCTLPDGSAEFINQRWLDYMGLSAEEARDWGWRVAIHDEDSTELVDTWRAAVATGEPFEAEARLRRADGEYRWFLFRAVPLRDELGNIVQWYGTNTDIEDRKQAEEIRTAQARQAGVRADVSAALSKPAHSGEFLRGSAEAIVRHLDAAFARIWTLNKEKNMLELQASAGMYTHLDGPHSRIPIGIQKIGLIAEEKKPHLTNDVMNDPRVTDKVWAQNEGMVSFAGYPLIVQDRVVGVMAMFARQRLSSATLDILASVADSIAQGIERKRAEEALRKAQVELAHVSRVTTLGELAASIAHEVNQPLAAIVTNGSACLRWLMGDSPNLEEARETARHVIRDGKRASEVINRIRALVRKTDSEKAQLDINQAVEEVVNLTEHEAVRKGVALRTELAGDLPFVVGDRVQLQQVILNLVMNGIEAMDTVTDRPREMVIRSCEHESDQLLVAVQDSGIGLDRQNLEKIFNTFYTTKPRGMGMGLKISRSIVENHGGRLWAVPNDDGPGATFQFTLHVVIEEEKRLVE
jgi:PAS domain S-box-containing protein